MPIDFLKGATNSFPLFSDPWWGPESFQHRWYDQWQNRFGEGGPEDVNRGVTGIDWDHEIMLRIWAHGCTKAGTFDADEVLKAMKAEAQTPTIIGPADWRGEDMWGIDNMVSPPIPVCEVTEVKEKRIQAQLRYEDWFESRKDTIIKEVEDKGMMYVSVECGALNHGPGTCPGPFTCGRSPAIDPYR
ncbi:MAG: hypothetical protein U5K73_09565 [Halofilum sp. (in: g-proteobacteria)]|nr:hypothetical protein [Halofilum sp. (in: g-proteobacteria)]